MNEVYWITRLDAIGNFLTTIATLGFVISVVIGAFAICNRYQADWKRHRRGSDIQG